MRIRRLASAAYLYVASWMWGLAIAILVEGWNQPGGLSSVGGAILAAVLICGPLLVVTRRLFRGSMSAMPPGARRMTGATATWTGWRDRHRRYPSLRQRRQLARRLAARLFSGLCLALAIPFLALGAIVPGLGGVLWSRLLGPHAGGQFRRARVYGQRTAEEQLAADRRPPLIFLRAFEDDQLLVRTRRSRRRHWVENVCFREERLEEVVARQLWRFGPVLAFGRPGEALPELGAVRTYAPHDNWQTDVTAHLASAGLVVLVLGRGAGLQWEIDQLARRGWLAKTVVIVPPDRARVESTWEEFCRSAGRADLAATLVRPDGSHPLVVCMDGAGATATAVFGRRHDEWHYEVALDVAAGAVAG